MDIAALEDLKLAIYPSQAPLLAVLQKNKALTKIFPKYVDYADVFSPDLPIDLHENTNINEHAIKLIEDEQPFYRSIHSLCPVELETVNT